MVEKKSIENKMMLCRVTAAALLAAAVAIASCGGSSSESGLRLGIEIPAAEPVVRLAEVLENPAEYHGRQIVMQGVVSGQCASLCEFFLLDGAHTATIYPQGFRFPKLERGKSVTIYAQVTSGEQVVLSALGLRME